MRRTAPSRVGALLLVGVLALAGCATTEGAGETARNNPKAVLGAVIGAGAGAAIAAMAGGNAGVIVASAVAGGVVGGAIGHHLDKKDKELAARNAAQAFEHARTGQASAWNNPDSGNHGSITPTKTYQLANGQYCREYRQEITVGGEAQQSYGTACRQPDGSWKVQS